MSCLFFKLVRIYAMLFVGLGVRIRIISRIKCRWYSNSLCCSWAIELTRMGKDFWEKDFGHHEEKLVASLLSRELPVVGGGQVVAG